MEPRTPPHRTPLPDRFTKTICFVSPKHLHRERSREVKNLKLKIFIAAIALALLFAGTAYADEGRTEEARDTGECVEGSQPDEEWINTTDTVVIAPAPTETDWAEEEIPEREDPEDRDRPTDEVTIGIDTDPAGDKDEVVTPYVGEDNDAERMIDTTKERGDEQNDDPPEDDATIGEKESGGLISPHTATGEEDKTNAIAVPIAVAFGCGVLVLGSVVKRN